MNDAQRNAVLAAITNAEDNLERAKMQRDADPLWVSGNGQKIDEVVATYEGHLAQLKEGM